MSERPVVYLIDGSSYVYRAFFAIRQQLSTAQGLPTKAVFGFKNMLQKLIRQEQPQYLGIAFDERGPTFRHEMDPTYKAHRPSMPDELAVQLPYIHRLVEALNIPKLSLSGYEADDVLGTLARHFEAEGCDVVLVSGDKDLCQLVTDHVTMLDTMKDQRVDIAAVKERFGVEPARVIEILGLMGDASDNIPGVPGIGEKTAMQLITEFGTIEDLLAHLDQVKRPKLRDSLAQYADSARQSRHLATIDVHTPIAVTLRELAMDPPHTAALRALYDELEFRADAQALSADEPFPVVAKSYRTIMSLADFGELDRLEAGADALLMETLRQARARLAGEETAPIEPLEPPIDAPHLHQAWASSADEMGVG